MTDVVFLAPYGQFAFIGNLNLPEQIYIFMVEPHSIHFYQGSHRIRAELDLCCFLDSCRAFAWHLIYLFRQIQWAIILKISQYWPFDPMICTSWTYIAVDDDRCGFSCAIWAICAILAIWICPNKYIFLCSNRIRFIFARVATEYAQNWAFVWILDSGRDILTKSKTLKVQTLKKIEEDDRVEFVIQQRSTNKVRKWESEKLQVC